MKISAKITVEFDCKSCGEICETETDFPWIDESRVFKCDFCGAASKIQFVPIQEEETSDD